MFLQQQLINILRASHCRSTHHYFALDALPIVQTDAGKRLVKVLLRYHDRYLTGAKDPDTRFRDYQNHVIHVTEGYWGGAPRMAHKWYDRLQHYLRCGRMSDAAHAAGVLSHYFTDPMQPLHTQHSDCEKLLHRPIEWSITKSYDKILQCWKDGDTEIVFQFSNQMEWLGEAILHGARFANQKFTPLLRDYDLLQGVDDPTAGLNQELRVSLAELFGLAITGWARVIERAAADAESSIERPLPTPSTTLPIVLAIMRGPRRLWLRYVEEREEQYAIANLLDEYARTGTLHDYLPAEVDIVHRVVEIYHAEHEWIRQREAKTISPTEGKVSDRLHVFNGNDSMVIPITPCRKLDRFVKKSVHNLSPLVHKVNTNDALVDVPLVDQRIAKRLAMMGIRTVGQFLRESATKIAHQLNAEGVTATTLSRWQSQVSLMCEMPGIGYRDAKLLVGAGYATTAEVFESEAGMLHREISAFIRSARGRQCLGRSPCPSLADVAFWIEAASTSVSSQRRAA